MDFLAPLHKLDTIQQRHTWSAVLFGTIKKFGDDQASNLAVVVSFYAFFSLFPLLLVFVTVLGYVLSGDQSLLHSVQNSVLGNFPVIGDSIKHNKISGSLPALVIGVLLSLYSGLGITGAANNAFDTIWGVPRHERANFIMQKLHGAGLLVGLGALFAVATAATGIVSGGLGGPLLLVFGVIVSVLLNITLFLAAFRFLSSEPPAWRALLPGAVLAAVLWTILQSVGGVYIDHIKSSDSAYGTFALVLGVVTWLHLGSEMTLYSAELNTVLAEKAWPRSLFGPSQPPEKPSAAHRDALDARVNTHVVGTSRVGTEAAPGDGDTPAVTAPG
jgi:membrane protein